jgi:hypothetical protein
MRKGKKKAPTLDELVAQERECRGLLDSSLRNLADEIGESLEPVSNDPDANCYYAEEIALHGSGLHYDATEWRKAVEALAEAMAKKKAA